LDTNNWR